MTCDEYLAILWNEDALSEVISDQFWRGGPDLYELFRFMKECAQSDNITLIDQDTWNYDEAMYECYRADNDKGLS